MKKVSLILFSCVLAVIFLELAIRGIATVKNIYSIEMMRYALELKIPDPLGEISHVHRPSANSKLMGVEVRINSLGCRGPEPDLNKETILVLGGSQTMGWGVPETNTFSSLLERYQKKQVLNCGVGNYNLNSQIKILQRLKNKLKIKKVIYQYFVNDIEVIELNRNSFIFKNSYLASFMYEKVKSLSYESDFNTLGDYYLNLYKNKKLIKTFNENISKLVNSALEIEIMILPDLNSLNGFSSYVEVFDLVEKVFTKSGMKTYNLSKLFNEKYGKNVHKLWVQRGDPHFNSEGHKLIMDFYKGVE